jgi:16S rRNA A1518/A1519 N6-dimethyltransferase RsmA/KsgA/DIM1 with predicted DNA glycosylase/AP lyase activity
VKTDQIKYYSGCYHYVKRREVVQKIVRSVLAGYHSTVLDVGCGDGGYTYPLSTIADNVNVSIFQLNA